MEMTQLRLPGRDLGPPELRDLAERLACDPALWREHVSFSDHERHFVSLHRDEHVDLWLICWTPASDTGWHDHDTSSGAVVVTDGVLEESAPRIGGEPFRRLYTAGQSFCFGSEHIHRIVGAAPRSVSLHAYSPPLWRLGQYSIDSDGVMRRTSISYAEELRPLAEPALA
jgi:hypothetical protein